MDFSVAAGRLARPGAIDRGGRLDRVELHQAGLHQVVLAEVAGKHTLAQAEPALGTGGAPLGLARQADQAVGTRFRTGVAGGNQGDGLAAVEELSPVLTNFWCNLLEDTE